MELENEILKAVATGLATTVVGYATSLWELAHDPGAPARNLEEGKKTIDLILAWSKATEQLQRTPASPLRDAAQAEIDLILQTVNERQHRYADARATKRVGLLVFLSYLRLAGLDTWFRRIAAFLFYVSVIMLIQTGRLIVAGAAGMSPSFIWWFVGAAALFWVLSWPKRKSRVPLAVTEKQMANAATATKAEQGP